MEKLIKTIKIVIASIAVSLLAGVIWLSFVDGSFEISKSIDIDKTPIEVRQTVTSLDKWPEWSPWLNTGSAPQSKVETDKTNESNTLKWNHILAGNVVVTSTTKIIADTINQPLTFTEPFNCNANIEWITENTENGTKVNMTIKGKLPFLYRAIARRLETILFMDIDRSLNLLKDYCENGKTGYSIVIEGIVKQPSFTYAGIKSDCHIDNLDSTMQNSFELLTKISQLNDINPLGTLSIYYDFGINADYTCSFTSAVIINEKVAIQKLETGRIKETKALKIRYSGDYKHLINAWASGLTYIRAKGIKQRMKINPYEIYVNTDANSESPEEWVTELYIPVR